MAIELSNITFTEQNDIVFAPGEEIINNGVANTLAGDDIIIGTGTTYGIRNNAIFDTGNGDATIIGTGSTYGIYNTGEITTGNGDTTIISTGVIYNGGIIKTGNGNDFILAGGGVDSTGTEYGIYNNGGIIDTGNGDDFILANAGFKSHWTGSGIVSLGGGEDYIKGFGSGDFYGGNDEDTLELTPGIYTVGIENTKVNFAKDNQLMRTSEFETLMAGGTTYDFTSLTEGQIITVA